MPSVSYKASERTGDDRVRPNLPWLPVLTALLLGALGGAVAVKGGVSSDALAGLFGVLVGSLIATAGQSLNAREDREHQLRVAALERRLAAHQEGYALWRKLWANVHQRDQIGAVVLECQTWWEQNCLYLSEPARTAFHRAFSMAGGHRDLVEARVSVDAMKESWAEIMAAGPAFVAGAALPPIGGVDDALPDRSRERTGA